MSADIVFIFGMSDISIRRVLQLFQIFGRILKSFVEKKLARAGGS